MDKGVRNTLACENLFIYIGNIFRLLDYSYLCLFKNQILFP